MSFTFTSPTQAREPTLKLLPVPVAVETTILPVTLPVTLAVVPVILVIDAAVADKLPMRLPTALTFCAAVILPVEVTNAPETLFVAIMLPVANMLPAAVIFVSATIVPVADNAAPLTAPVADIVLAFKADDVVIFPIALIVCPAAIFPLTLMLPPAFN